MYNFELKDEQIENFIDKGQISFYPPNKNSIFEFLTRLPELDFLIEKVFADILTNLNSEFISNIKDRIIRTAIILPLDNYTKNIAEYKKIEQGHCIVQLKENVRAENIFKEEEILTLENTLSRFSQISRTVLKDENNEICFIKMLAILKIQDKTFVIQMTYIKLGETRFYDYENNLIFFVHPIFVEQIIVNKAKSGFYNTFKKYYLQEYSIEKTYSKEEQEKCNNLRLNYNPMIMPCVSLSEAQMIGFYY